MSSWRVELHVPPPPRGLHTRTNLNNFAAGSYVVSGSVAEAGWTGGIAPAAVVIEMVDDGVEVGQQKVGEVVAEAVAAHDPQHAEVLAVGGERVGRYLP